ncbi:MAG: hypothetical protein ACW98K_04900 [Candidatus Kariarchaeaceae archaeon]|jgi:hypothetical protein
MGAFGSVLGGIMTMGSFFLGIWTVWTWTDNYYPLLLFLIFGILGGLALGALNGRKARTQVKYKNEYTGYAGMAFAAIIFLGIYFGVMATGTIEDNIADEDMSATSVVGAAVASGLLALFGLGLVVANSLTDER